MRSMLLFVFPFFTRLVKFFEKRCVFMRDMPGRRIYSVVTDTASAVRAAPALDAARLFRYVSLDRNASR
jgi:hypothetical protein